MVALVGVIEHDVQDDLDAGLVQRLHHVAELAQVAAAPGVDAVSGLGREEADGAVSPVIGKGHAVHDTQDVGFIEVEHRHQLDRGDAQILEVRYLLDDAGKRPGMLHARKRASG